MDATAAADPIVIDSFAAFTLGIIVYFLGAKLTKRFSILSSYSIPEPVSGGLAAAFCALVIVVATGRTIEYDLSVRDFLLVYFFTTVGLNARVSDLARGGPILAVMLALTLVFMLVQNGVGAAGALLFGMPSQSGVLLGTASLIGGHGTAIAWGPTIASQYGVAGAAELGIASATVGLILASILGGPIAKYLITKNSLTASDGEDADEPHEAAATDETRSAINHVEIMRCILWIHVAIVIGYSAHESLLAAGLKLPLFVPCLISGIVLSNVVPLIFRKAKAPAGTQSMDLINEFSLSVFLSMSLMSMELWTLAGSAGVLAVTMLLQAAAATVFIVLVVFRVMGRNYFAAVLSAGFAGFALGATPTAIANMKAVTQRYGPSPLAFIVLPLISAFFVDLANAFIIQWFLGLG
ncbi:sodium/glutamate symporter [Roseibium album]|uniref:Sodium/glutamate symporter n=1 Tax=Roseibium album TaxID=311410 RepID=A0A0M6ZGZ7_9HYPH|nr:sodium/glutamate symporter [Roseibium album]CTQ61386.1 Glutamate permease [Roseibium album]CTQ68182.1 Glutamate permease [Roseibium album]CTQ79305.1 Glutamate permease [Roseibium album]